MTGLASFEHLRSWLYLSLALNALIITAEFIGGFILDSVGLIGNAGMTGFFTPLPTASHLILR